MENISGYVVVNNNLVSVIVDEDFAQHDRLCRKQDKRLNPNDCSDCELIRKIMSESLSWESGRENAIREMKRMEGE